MQYVYPFLAFPSQLVDLVSSAVFSFTVDFLSNCSRRLYDND